jgi:apolipoprotein D and lipocalin family protein
MVCFFDTGDIDQKPNLNMKKSTLAIGGAIIGVVAVAALSSCRTIPEGAVAVKPFDSEKYLGKWYEIARFDFRFEKGLNNTTANYSMNENGTIKVVNRGYDFRKDRWKQSVGKAKFLSDKDEAKLKVSFFGPFYAGYNVIALDQEYRYALIAGKNLKYLWLLSRETTMPQDVKDNYLSQAIQIGYDTSKLVWIGHSKK